MRRLEPHKVCLGALSVAAAFFLGCGGGGGTGDMTGTPSDASARDAGGSKEHDAAGHDAKAHDAGETRPDTGEEDADAADAGDDSSDGGLVEGDDSGDGGIEPDGGGEDGGFPDGGALADVPIEVDYLTGDLAFVVPVTLGGNTIMAILDTGSSGLRVIQGAVPSDSFATKSSTKTSITYGSGTVASGIVATAQVTLGGLSTPAPIPVQIITAVSCTASKPNCPAAGGNLSSFSFKGGSGGTYKAIVGVGMRSLAGAQQVANPIVQFEGEPGFVVDISGGYGATSGVLHIGPDATEKALFHTRQLPPLADGAPLMNGAPVFDDRTNPMCIDDKTQDKMFCADALFDTGNGPSNVNWTATKGAGGPLPSGDSVQVTVSGDDDAGAPVLGTYAFTVGATPRPGRDKVVIIPSTTDNSINVGTGIFFRQLVLLDQANGAEGLAPF